MKPKWQMSDEERIRDFQRKLYLKAKQEKEFRFYILYDKVRTMRFLREAYKKVKANKGKSGVDGVTFKEIENYGVETYLKEIQKELEEKRYKPSAVLRVYIPKANGKLRPLGIPTIKDRIVQMSCKMVIEPIFEADFEESSYGFRPKRSAQQAITVIKQHLQEGKT
ncbi:MAG: group II intron reverse transcriptase/maturase, partial [Spirochaetes bacterium]|nr:group II intron reverse transcriptase/maturase [Spirochaetota bacterium]